VTDRLLIFDFDGVVADSEVAANALLAQAISAIGHPTTLEDCLHHYMGRRWSDCVLAIEGRIGRPLPPGFEAARRAEMEAHETELHAVAGVAAFIERFGHLRRCVASSARRHTSTACSRSSGSRTGSAKRSSAGRKWLAASPSPISSCTPPLAWASHRSTAW
jgi:beta-phosphoglucomutase-like phosphatase (HAD superfamily)